MTGMFIRFAVSIKRMYKMKNKELGFRKYSNFCLDNHVVYPIYLTVSENIQCI